MLKNLLPKSKLTWMLVILLLASYVLYEKEYAPFPKEGETARGNIILSSAQKSTKFLENPANSVIETMQQTKTGRSIVDAFLSSALQEQYGTNDIVSISGKITDDLLLLDLEQGDGPTAKCMNKVRVHTQTYAQGNMKVDSTVDKDAPITLVIGKQKHIPGLEQGIIGMTKGGKRKLVIPPRMAYGLKEFTSNFIPSDQPVTVEVQLLDIIDPIENYSAEPLVTDIVKGIGDSIKCGDKVKISYKMGYTDESTIRLTPKHVMHATVGDGTLPLGLELGIMGIKIGGTRGIVVAPILQTIQNRINTPFKDTSLLPRDEMVTFEVDFLSMSK